MPTAKKSSSQKTVKAPKKMAGATTEQETATVLKAPLYGEDGALKGDIELAGRLFNAKVRPALMHEASLMQRSNARHPIAHTMTKGEVRGGGRKPYRQKGTGNARQGSIRNPHFKGGGVTFGPRSDRNWVKSMPKTARRQALFSALTLKAQDQKILALENFTAAKTKTFVQLLKKLPVERDVLFVLAEKNDNAYRATRNIPYVKTILAAYLNVNDVLSYHHILFLSAALKKAEDTFKATGKNQRV